MKKKDCLNCGVEFGLTHNRQQYCTKECCAKAHRLVFGLRNAFVRLEIKPCPVCSEEFLGFKRKVFCGRKCKAKASNSKPHRKEWQRAYRLEYVESLRTKLRRRVANSIYQKLIRNKFVKNGATFDFLPYTVSELKAHLESFFNERNGFTWDNYGKLWSIDHVYPHSWFNYTSMDQPEFRDCWALSNLRPAKKSLNFDKRNYWAGYFDDDGQKVVLEAVQANAPWCWQVKESEAEGKTVLLENTGTTTVKLESREVFERK